MKRSLWVTLLLVSVVTLILVLPILSGASASFVAGGGQSVSLSTGCTPVPQLGVCVVLFGLSAHNGPGGASGSITLNWPDLHDQMLADVTCVAVSGSTADITGTITKQKNGAGTGGFFSRVVVHVTHGTPDTFFASFDNGVGCGSTSRVLPVLRGSIVTH